MREFLSLFGTAVAVVAATVAAFLAGYGVSGDSYAEPTVVAIASPEEDSASIDYRDGHWTFNGRTVPLSCTEEDSCTADYHDAAWHFTRVIS